MVAEEAVRRVLAVASNVGARALLETTQQRRPRLRDAARVLGDERNDSALLVLDRVGGVARARRHPAEDVSCLNGTVRGSAARPRAEDVTEQLLL
eukprot:6841402-Prymnesium_polylepis.1